MSETEIFFYEFIPYGYSTIEEPVALQLLESGNAKLRSKTIMKVVPASVLAPLMKPSDATFLSLDIEGTEYEALNSIDWEVTTPRVICIEEWDGADIQGRIAGLLTEKVMNLKKERHFPPSTSIRTGSTHRLHVEMSVLYPSRYKLGWDS